MVNQRPGDSVDLVHRTLRERIIEGHYPPGLRLSQGALATELDVSRTPCARRCTGSKPTVW